jgi:hypothetical protein
MPKNVNKWAFRKQIGALYDLHPTLVKKGSPELTKTMLCIKSCFVANPVIGDVYNGKGKHPNLETINSIGGRGLITEITNGAASGKTRRSRRPIIMAR